MPFTPPDLLRGQKFAALLDMLPWSAGTSASPAAKCDCYDVIVIGIDKNPEIFALRA